jgi:hypothetical protein
VVLEGEPHDEEISASVTSSSHNFQPHAFLAKPHSELRVKPRSILNACVAEEKFLIHVHKRNNMQDGLVEEMEGVEATGMDVDSPPLMTEQERRILEVYDRQEELQLEIALLKVRGILSQGT